MYQQLTMIQIHCANDQEADAAWRMLCSVPASRYQPVELHLAGYGCLYQVVRTQEGEQIAVRPEAQQVRSSPG